MVRVSFYVRSGRLHVGRMLSRQGPLAGIELSAAGDEFPFQSRECGRVSPSFPEGKCDLDAWRWLTDKSGAARGGSRTARMYIRFSLPASRILIDASKPAVDIRFVELDIWSRYDFSVCERQIVEDGGGSNIVLKPLGVPLAA